MLKFIYKNNNGEININKINIFDFSVFYIMKSYFMELKEIIKTLKRIKRKSNKKNKNDANHGGYQAHLGGELKHFGPLNQSLF